MTLSARGLEEIKGSEAFRAKPYQDIAGVWTIGYGSTYYLDGKRVSQADPPITEKQAELLLLSVFNKDFARFIPANVNQNQYDALASLVYNIGAKNFNDSTLKKKVLANPNDITIRDEFLKWNKAKANGVLRKVNGLTIRRKREAELYFEPEV